MLLPREEMTQNKCAINNIQNIFYLITILKCYIYNPKKREFGLLRHDAVLKPEMRYKNLN